MPSLVLYKGKLLAINGSPAVAEDPCDCCEEDEPCGTQAESGGPGVTILSYAMPEKAGKVRFFYEAFGIPDRFEVEGGGQVFVDTTIISGSGTEYFCKPEGLTKVTVTVTGPEGTRWRYEIGCPEDPCDEPPPDPDKPCVKPDDCFYCPEENKMFVDGVLRGCFGLTTGEGPLCGGNYTQEEFDRRTRDPLTADCVNIPEFPGVCCDDVCVESDECPP